MFIFCQQQYPCVILTDKQRMQNLKIEKLRSKLSYLLGQAQQIKKDLIEIRDYHKTTFVFSSLLPAEAKKIISLATIRNMDKQNLPAIMNQNKPKNCNRKILFDTTLNELDKENMKSNANIQKDKKIAENSLKKYLSTKVEETTKNREQNKFQEPLKSRDELIKLRNNLWLQLKQIKNIQKKQETIRKANERMKSFNSENKRQYQESLSRQKSCKSLTGKHSGLKQSVVFEQKISQREDSEIQINIPISLEHQFRPTRTKALFCPKGHQYYDGLVNDQDQPHGNGRLQICCLSIPMKGIHHDVQFYQGQFRQGNFHGFGTMSYKGGIKYVGEFIRGKRQGKGSLYHNGKAETAKWANDKFIKIM